MKRLYASKEEYSTDGSIIKMLPHHPNIIAVGSEEMVDNSKYAPVSFVTYMRDFKSNLVLTKNTKDLSGDSMLEYFYSIKSFALNQDEEETFETLSHDKCLMSALEFVKIVFDISDEQVAQKIPEIVMPLPLGFVYSKEHDTFYIVNCLAVDVLGAMSLTLNEGWNFELNYDQLVDTLEVNSIDEVVDKIVLNSFVKVGNTNEQ